MPFSKPVLCALFCAGLTFSVTQESKAATPCDPASTVCLGQPCDTLGASQIDKDGKNIIVCLNPETGSQKVWKGAQTKSLNELPSGASAGWCMNGWGGYYVNNIPNLSAGSSSSTKPPAVWGGNQVGCQCPAGWTIKITGTCNFGDCKIATTHPKYKELYFYTCVKN